MLPLHSQHTLHPLLSLLPELIVLPCRATVLSLVCKAWYQAEKLSYQPQQLDLTQRTFTPSFLTWHLRNCSKLRVVAMQDPTESLGGSAVTEIEEGMKHLLQPLLTRAPALRTLHLASPGYTSFHRLFRFLPLIGDLSQLESLFLIKWHSSRADMHLLSHLSRLQNLKVPFVSWKS